MSMPGNFIVSMENSLIDNIFSQEDRLVYHTTMEEDNVSQYPVDRVLEKINRLPAREADMLMLYFFQKKDQADIGVIFKLTQGAISYRLKRAIQRLKFLLAMPDLDKAQMIEDLSPFMPEAIYLEVMVGMWETTSQSAVARRLSTSQGRVRYRFMKGLKNLRENLADNPHMQVYVDIFERISDSYNILNELNGERDYTPGSFLDVVRAA
jgi:DNA-directed RNA polymerase specialized sigma24 family protein